MTTMHSRPNAEKGCVRLALMLRPRETSRIRLAAQLGVNSIIANVCEELDQVPRRRYRDRLAKLQADCKELGMAIAGIESHPVSAEKIKLGLPGRDEEIENYCAALEALGELGIPMVCYNFMAGIGWCRTDVSVRGRGGAFTSEFDLRAAEERGLTEWGEISEQKIWENLDYFLKAVMPVAEKAGVKMALHPDDPPLSPLRGIGRILTSAASFRRVLSIAPSPVNGITFCQANFKLMGEDLAALVREWCGQNKIFFVHFRDVEGTADHFVETFHDNGPTDMAAMMQAYYEAGFSGPMRPDHAPTMEGESNENPGYEILGKIFAIGYMKGIMARAGIPYA